MHTQVITVPSYHVFSYLKYLPCWPYELSYILIFIHPTSVSIHRHPVSLHNTPLTINTHFHPTKSKPELTKKYYQTSVDSSPHPYPICHPNQHNPKLHPAPAAPSAHSPHIYIPPAPRSSTMGRAGYDTTYVCTTTDSAATTAIAMADAQRTKDAVRTKTANDSQTNPTSHH